MYVKPSSLCLSTYLDLNHTLLHSPLGLAQCDYVSTLSSLLLLPPTVMLEGRAAVEVGARCVSMHTQVCQRPTEADCIDDKV